MGFRKRTLDGLRDGRLPDVPNSLRALEESHERTDVGRFWLSRVGWFFVEPGSDRAVRGCVRGLAIGEG